MDGAGRDDQPDREVDEEDRAPVDQLREQTAQQHPDRRAGSADGAPDAQCASALVALELRGDDRQSGGREERGAEPLSGSSGEQRGGAAR